MKNWLAEQKKSMKESSSFKYELLIKFVSCYHKINCIFSYCFFIFSYLFSWQNSSTFFENKQIPSEGYSGQNLLLLVALSAQLKRWLIKSERTCCIQGSVPGHLLWKVTFSYNLCTDYAWKKTEFCSCQLLSMKC